jgi:16S rRNA (guanine(1405)-N(7))-methyltransferase
MTELEAIVAAVRSSRKYRAICQDTIERVAARELANRGSVKEATKATKRRLHQVYGAFEEGLDYDAAYEKLEAAYRSGSDAEIEAACREVLAGHSSTRERLPILERFYGAIHEAAGGACSILDLGCGLNPLALPWMRLGPAPRYSALDIDAERVRFLNRYLLLAGLRPPAGIETPARCQDVLARPPREEADLALLLKMSPTLERQVEGSTLRLLQQINTPVAAVSFALKSLGGREKGMPDHYGRQFRHLVASQPWTVRELAFENELVFVVIK